jgi:hypothetical protein
VQRKVQAPKPAKVAKRETSGDPVTQVLSDPTLRRDDIVVLPDGPKVFTGGAGPSAQAHNFENARSSKLLPDTGSG